MLASCAGDKLGITKPGGGFRKLVKVPVQYTVHRFHKFFVPRCQSSD